VLIATARADGHLDAEDADVIMDYAGAEGARKGALADEVALAELRRNLMHRSPGQ